MLTSQRHAPVDESLQNECLRSTGCTLPYASAGDMPTQQPRPAVGIPAGHLPVQFEMQVGRSAELPRRLVPLGREDAQNQ